MGPPEYSPNLGHTFFDQSPIKLAISLLGKVLKHRFRLTSGDDIWLSARIIETEAYYVNDRASHSSLGYTNKRRALFMQPGTIYMYYARGRDSLNFSASGDGNGVLIKSGYPYLEAHHAASMLTSMQMLNPGTSGPRQVGKLCNGQTLVCQSLNLKVRQWNAKQLDPDNFCLQDDCYYPDKIIQCRRLGIPFGRDEHLPLRFVDAKYAQHATHNPLTQRRNSPGSIRVFSDPFEVNYPPALL